MCQNLTKVENMWSDYSNIYATVIHVKLDMQSHNIHVLSIRKMKKKSELEKKAIMNVVPVEESECLDRS